MQQPWPKSKSTSNLQITDALKVGDQCSNVRLAFIQIAKAACARLKETPSTFENICVGYSVLQLSFSRKISWNVLLSCWLHRDSCVIECVEWWHPWRIFLPPFLSVLEICLIVVYHIELMQTWGFSFGLFQLRASLLAAKNISLEKTSCVKTISSLLSELILLFSPKDLLTTKLDLARIVYLSSYCFTQVTLFFP